MKNRSRVVRAVTVAGLCTALLSSLAHAYDPGSGALFSEDFDGVLDDGWELESGFFTATSPWEQRADGADESFYADGIGPIGGSPTLHWAAHPLHPVSVTSFSTAFEYRGEIGPGYEFYLDVVQRAETLRKYRMRIDGAGTVGLWRSESGAMAPVAATAANAVPANAKTWLRFAVEPDPSGHPRLRARIWSGGAAAEPATWDLDFLDTLDTLERVHRLELVADGPAGIRTWIDDLDAWGDEGRGVVSSVTDIYMVELSHLDIGFTEPPDDIALFAKSHLDLVLGNLSADPDYRWVIEAGWWLDRWWELSDDGERQQMLAALDGGRLVLTAGYANQTTTFLGHEELIRNVYYSSRLARAHGFPLRTWITDDVPGTSFAVPEILARSGIDYFVGGMNTTFGGRVDEPDHGDRPFWWVGPDGSKVLSWITFDSYAEGFQYGFSFFDNLAAMYDKLGTKLPEQEEAGYDYPELMLLRGFDNHYQNLHVRNLVNQWNATYETPVFHLSTPEEFLDMMRAKYGDTAFPSYSGDFGAAWARSRANAPHTHERIRRAHREARAAESLLASAWALDGAAYPASDVDFMYRRMLESDEHTGAGGWPGYFTPEEMDRNNRIHLGYATDAADTAGRLLRDGLDRLVADLPASGDAVAAINPLGRTRDGWVRVVLPAALFDSDFRVVERGGPEVPYQKFAATEEILFRASSVPSFGYRVYDLLPGAPTAVPGGTLEVSPTTLENDFYAVTIDPSTGAVTGLYDKSRSRELIDAGSPYAFNELASSTKQQYDTQAAPIAEPPASAATAVAEGGPLVVSIRVTRSGTPHVETTYRLYRNDDRLVVENVLDRDQMPYVPQSIAVRAYTVTLPFDTHAFEIRSETTTRFLDPIGDSFPRGSVFDWHNSEHTLAFWDTAGGVLYAADAAGAHHFENLSSLASGSYSNSDALLLPRLNDRADEYEFEGGTVGPFVVEPGTSPILRFTHHVRATGPSFDPVGASRFGFESLSPLRARLLGRRGGNLPDDAGSFFAFDAANVLPFNVKRSEDGGAVSLRLTEMTGAPTTVAVTSDALSLANPARVEQDEEGGSPLAMDGDAVLVPLAPYETATVRVETSPAWTPIVLTVDKNAAAGEVTLNWTGGVAPFTLLRAEDPRFSQGIQTLQDEQPPTSHVDPALTDGVDYYYLVR